jgi:hypothetical protein
MATKKTEHDPAEVIHLQVKPGGTARLGDKSFGDRATIQVARGDRGAVTGPVEEVDPDRVPDVGDRAAAA